MESKHLMGPVTVDHPMNLISSTSRFEGKLEISEYSHFNGQLFGEILCKEGSTLVVGEQGVVEGRIQGDTVIVDGYVRGEIHAESKLVISETGRVLGKVTAPSFVVVFGGHFEGDCSMGYAVTKENLVPA
jgi:cytoskeletal protein CcmA (bactofilin family)